MAELKYIGKPAQRVGGLEKVMGKTKYVGDYNLPGMLYARTLRSDLPHARIKRLDVSPALKVPGVLAAITSEDFHNHGQFGFPIKDMYMLAYEKVRYVGEGIATVAAETPAAAAAGMQAIICELEELPAIFDMDEALAPEAPQVGPLRADGKHPNFLGHYPVYKGNPEEMLKQCDVTIDQKYETVMQEHAYIETEGALGIATTEGGVVVYVSCQSPFIPRGHIASVLNLPEGRVRVIVPPVGGSFGGKDDLNYQAAGQVAALALKTKRPVRMTFSREESMIASYKRGAMRMNIRLGADKDGTLRACQFKSTYDSGAYSSQSPFTSWRASIHAMGAYRYDACTVDINTVYTNQGYAGAYRGFGNTEVCSGIEQAVDEMADALKMDPMDFRLKNCLKVGDVTPHSQTLTESVGLTDCLLAVRKMSDWDRKRKNYSNQPVNGDGKRRGIGVAALFHGTSLGAEGADEATGTIELHDDNLVTLTSGLTDYGTGSRTVYTLIAAEVLGIDPSRIRVHLPDTNTAKDSGPTVASRATMLGGNATKVAALNLLQNLDWAAADLLNCDLHQLQRVGESYVGPSEEPVSWETVVSHAREMGLVLSAHGKWTAPLIQWDEEHGTGIPYFAYHFGAQVAEVEVDMNTGLTDVIGLWAVHDIGKVIFPQGAYGQLYGGISHGFGYALYEDVDYMDGYLQSVNFDTYLIPTSADMPEIHGGFVEAEFSQGPFGAKNIAEPAMVPTAPAILNAIAHASGRRIRKLPANLERVMLGEALKKKASTVSCKVALNIT
ncbi:MAG: xanthine dehydrogenase family protein [Anaerolineaceae bacterium]|nr:xanthine dehydrogenase family protein [Anaerolineaceae bacterium]